MSEEKKQASDLETLRKQLVDSQNAVDELKKEKKTLKIKNTLLNKKFEAHGDPVAGAPLTLGEVGGGIEPVSANDFVDVAEMEAFMNEPVKLLVHLDNNEASLRVVTFGVNAMNQPVVRGREQVIKRKYLEVIARTKTTTIQQRVNNPLEPDSILNVPVTMLTYPFQVIEDRNPRGRAWLQAIMDENNL